MNGEVSVQIDVLRLVDVPAALAARFHDRATGRAVAEAFGAALERALSDRLAGASPPRSARPSGTADDDLDRIAGGVAAAIAAQLWHHPVRTGRSGGPAHE